MVDWKVGRFHIKNLEIFTFTILTTLYTLAGLLKPGTSLYNWIGNLSQGWYDLAVHSSSALFMAFIFSTFANTSILIVFPYALIVYNIGQVYPNFWLLGFISGLGAGIGEITSYLVGRLIGSSKRMSESEMGERFYRIKREFEKRPGLIPIMVFLFAATPLPDDVILVPFGIMKYSYWKTVPFCMAGKTVLCILLAYLGYIIGQNAEVLNQLIMQYPFLSFLYLFIPSTTINPAADLIQFSFIFIVIYVMVRFDFQLLFMKMSQERKDFEGLVLQGGNFTLEQLILEFKITNVANFQTFLTNFSKEHTNFKIDLEIKKVHFDAIIDHKKAHEQSMEFARFMNT